MTVSVDLRWRAIVLIFVYGLPVDIVASVLGISERSIERWHGLFKRNGNVMSKTRERKSSRWPTECVTFVKHYVEAHPCFYLEELQEALKYKLQRVPNLSVATICRALRFDLGMTRKVLTKRARECAPHEIDNFYKKLEPFYSGPDQLVFVDETSKDGRDALRRFAWSKRNTPAVVSLPFGRGERVSVLAAINVNGFFGWDTTTVTFDRERFHEVIRTKVAPFLNPWPLPR